MLSTNKVIFFTTLYKDPKGAKLLNPINLTIKSIFEIKLFCIDVLLLTKQPYISTNYTGFFKKTKINSSLLIKLFLYKKNKRNLLIFFSKNKFISIQLNSCLMLFNFLKNLNFLSEIKFGS